MKNPFLAAKLFSSSTLATSPLTILGGLGFLISELDPQVVCVCVFSGIDLNELEFHVLLLELPMKCLLLKKFNS